MDEGKKKGPRGPKGPAGPKKEPEPKYEDLTDEEQDLLDKRAAARRKEYFEKVDKDIRDAEERYEKLRKEKSGESTSGKTPEEIEAKKLDDEYKLLVLRRRIEDAKAKIEAEKKAKIPKEKTEMEKKIDEAKEEAKLLGEVEELEKIKAGNLKKREELGAKADIIKGKVAKKPGGWFNFFGGGDAAKSKTGPGKSAGGSKSEGGPSTGLTVAACLALGLLIGALPLLLVGAGLYFADKAL